MTNACVSCVVALRDKSTTDGIKSADLEQDNMYYLFVRRKSCSPLIKSMLARLRQQKKLKLIIANPIFIAIFTSVERKEKWN